MPASTIRTSRLATARERVLLLPVDPDASAERSAAASSPVRTGKRIAVIVSDSFGRPFRRGTVGIALGAAGLPAVIDWRGHPDLFGRKLEVTETGFADEIAAAASLVHGAGRRGDADRAGPRPQLVGAGSAGIAELVRPPEHDLFR